jgi:hypothetical protein
LKREKFGQWKKLNKKVGKASKLQGKWLMREAKSARKLNNEVWNKNPIENKQYRE